MIAKKRVEKVSFNLPVELKEKALELKKEMKISLNTIYKNAIAEYIEKKEIEKWKRGVDLALQNDEYMKFCEEMGNTGGELYEYD